MPCSLLRARHEDPSRGPGREIFHEGQFADEPCSGAPCRSDRVSDAYLCVPNMQRVYRMIEGMALRCADGYVACRGSHTLDN